MNKVIVTPEGICRYPHIKTPNKTFNPDGLFSCDLVVEEADAKAFAKEVEKSNNSLSRLLKLLRKLEVTSNHYFVRVKNKDFNFSQNPTYVSGSDGSLKIDAFKGNSKTFITTVGLYGEQNDDLLAVAKLSKPILKDKTREALIKVKLDF